MCEKTRPFIQNLPATEVAAEPTGNISATPIAANQIQINKPSSVCNWETTGYIIL